SPWTRRGVVVSTMYNQVSVLRTMELILGLTPLTIHDAGATPMFGVFANVPSPQTYTLVNPDVSLTYRNPEKSATAERSRRMNFRDADEIDDQELNAILWTVLKGSDVPPPVRSRFGR